MKRLTLLAAALSLLAAGCSDDDSNAGGSGGDESSSEKGTSNSGDASDPWAQARIDCVDRINAFRATEDKPPLERWTEKEACVDDQSKADSKSGAHANFGDCDEWAQNTCPGYGSLDGVLTGCLQMMWDEGPGEPYSEHGHYLNMSSTDYTKVACGFYEMPNGEIWHNHDFQ